MQDEIKTNLSSPDTWLRLLLMIIFGFVASILIYLVWIIAAAQFVFSIITSKVNQNLDEFSGNLVSYLTRIFEYLMYKSDLRPFPFSPWEDMLDNEPVSRPASTTKSARDDE